MVRNEPNGSTRISAEVSADGGLRLFAEKSWAKAGTLPITSALVLALIFSDYTLDPFVARATGGLVQTIDHK